ncbi:helix-turn-helix domain-containing protein (plasmid) [Pseudomonas silesiensis]|uniref:LexA family protein n=1 Tax=Pseudomonas silesiensis TaxID=1853130 RepID=UPI0030D1DE08
MKLSDTGLMVFKGREFTTEQMQGRSIALAEIAAYLMHNKDRLKEAQSLADDLLVESHEWAQRAKRCNDALTPGQRRTYVNILALLASQGRSPTMVELAKIDKVTSTTIRRHVQALIKKGFVQQKPNVPGGLSITNAPRGGQTGLRDV